MNKIICLSLFFKISILLTLRYLIRTKSLLHNMLTTCAVLFEILCAIVACEELVVGCDIEELFYKILNFNFLSNELCKSVLFLSCYRLEG